MPEGVAIRIGRRLPGRIKRWLKDAYRASVGRIRPFGPTDLTAALVRVGLRPDDVVMVHSSFSRFMGFRGGPDDVIRVLEEIVGPSGALLMPTMPFRGSVVEYASAHPVFDVRRTASKMGLLSELFRHAQGVRRSLHPTHAVAAWGGKADMMIGGHHLARTPCGPDTPYGRLFNHDGKVLFLGASWAAMTIFHTLEEELETRLPFPVFDEREFVLHSRDETDRLVVSRVRLYGRHLAGYRNLAPLVAQLKKEDAWHATRVGSVNLILLSALDVRHAITKLTAQGVFCYDSGVRALAVPKQGASLVRAEALARANGS